MDAFRNIDWTWYAIDTKAQYVTCTTSTNAPALIDHISTATEQSYLRTCYNSKYTLILDLYRDRVYTFSTVIIIMLL